jgi:hypothetical protein
VGLLVAGPAAVLAGGDSPEAPAAPPAAASPAASRETLAVETATLFRAARVVLSQRQAHINNPDLGDKGLTGGVVVAATKENYVAMAKRDFSLADEGSIEGKVQRAMFESIEEVMDQAQDLINEKGKGFKGFLPAVFGRQVAERFSKRMDGLVAIKLTAPKAYVRNRRNLPDEWESAVIEERFKSAGWETGKSHFEDGQSVRGRKAARLILPEYYQDSCLGCHGEPKGERDISGGKKEGGKLGELGGAISVVVYE